MTAPDSKCGTCTACCKVYAIPELSNKPAGEWCQHCNVGQGCGRYETRPATCVEFECMWLQSQAKETTRQPLELRPDKCKVVFNMSTSPRVMTATTMPGTPDAWHKPIVRQLIDRMLRGGLAVAIGLPAASKQILLTSDGAQTIVEMTEPDENGIQWSKT